MINNVVIPFREIAAYEALWDRPKVSYKTLAELFEKIPFSLPSTFVNDDEIDKYKGLLNDLIFDESLKYKINLLIDSTIDFPKGLKDARNPVEVLYYSGNIDYLYSKSIAVVGTRKPTENGLRRAEKIVKLLVKDGYTIVSGLATGIDTKAHKTAINEGGRTISVIGTPLNRFYPKQNSDLQIQIANEHLLISQVPFYRYSKQTPFSNRWFFPERNKTMSALSLATIIVEASDTSGTLIQARAALSQGRKLFILDSCFKNPSISWPEKYLKKGAIKVTQYSDITENLA